MIIVLLFNEKQLYHRYIIAELRRDYIFFFDSIGGIF